jgi:hypothetical protein
MLIISTILTCFVLALALVLGRRVRVWWRFRGDSVVRCPENHQPAGVRVDAWHARRKLQLIACTRWPAKAGCGQECLAEIAASPENCLVRNIAAKWYQGKRCAVCGNAIGAIEWGPSQPAVILSDQNTVQWKEVSADVLTETLETALPICFACHMANRLVREHPELVTERNSPR